MIRSRTASSLLLIVATVALGACSSSDDTASSDDPIDDPTVTGDPTTMTDDGIDPRNGFPYCPTDPSLMTEEPCSDEFGAVVCKVNSGFPGDELALCHRPEDTLLLHYGPDPSQYDNPDAIAPFLMGPGEENENCMFVESENQNYAFLTNYHGRLRPQSHHLIVTTIDGTPEISPLPVPCRQTEVVGSRWLAGSQDPQIDVARGASAGPDGTDDSSPQPGDPDYGLATRIEGQSPVRLDLHYINATDEIILREAWLSFDYVAEEDVVTTVDMITFYQGDIFVPPYGSSETAKARCVAPTDRYVGLITGHFHENGTRFTVWKEDLAGNEQVVYETFDWDEPGNLYYRDGMENPTPNATTLTHGGHSGYLHLKQGESLRFQCAFDNPTNVPVGLGDQGKDQMCNVFGMYYPTDGNVWSCACLGEGCF